MEGAAEPLDAILWGLAEPVEAVWGDRLNPCLRRTLSGLARNPGVGRYRPQLPGGSLSSGRYRSGSARRTHIRLSRPKWTFWKKRKKREKKTEKKLKQKQVKDVRDGFTFFCWKRQRPQSASWLLLTVWLPERICVSQCGFVESPSARPGNL